MILIHLIQENQKITNDLSIWFPYSVLATSLSISCKYMTSQGQCTTIITYLLRQGDVKLNLCGFYVYIENVWHINIRYFNV